MLTGKQSDITEKSAASIVRVKMVQARGGYIMKKEVGTHSHFTDDMQL